MHLGTIPAGGRAAPHVHDGHESAIYLISGRVAMDFGDELQEHVEVGPGDFCFIPAGMPHRPYNASETEPAVFVLARSHPSEDEPTVVLEDPGAGSSAL